MQHSLTEANLLELVAILKAAAEDMKIEASVNEELYKCDLREVATQINWHTEKLDSIPCNRSVNFSQRLLKMLKLIAIVKLEMRYSILGHARSMQDYFDGSHEECRHKLKA